MKRGIRTYIYKDKSGEFRWRTLAGNNKIIGAATEGYKNKADCISNAKMFGLKDLIDKTIK